MDPTTIYCVIYYENRRVIKIIIKQVDNQEIKMARLNQFIFHVTWLGKTSVIEFAVDLGADLEARDNSGRNAFFLAATHGRIDAVRFLLDNQILITMPDSSRISFFQEAVVSQEVVEERFRYFHYHEYQYAGVHEAGW